MRVQSIAQDKDLLPSILYLKKTHDTFGKLKKF